MLQIHFGGEEKTLFLLGWDGWTSHHSKSRQTDSLGGPKWGNSSRSATTITTSLVCSPTVSWLIPGTCHLGMYSRRNVAINPGPLQLHLNATDTLITTFTCTRHHIGRWYVSWSSVGGSQLQCFDCDKEARYSAQLLWPQHRIYPLPDMTIITIYKDRLFCCRWWKPCDRKEVKHLAEKINNIRKKSFQENLGTILLHSTEAQWRL